MTISIYLFIYLHYFFSRLKKLRVQRHRANFIKPYSHKLLCFTKKKKNVVQYGDRFGGDEDGLMMIPEKRNLCR